MSTAIRSAVNRRVNNPQTGNQIPQNRAVPTVGFQDRPPPIPSQQQQQQQQPQQQQQQRIGSNMSLQQSFDLVFNRLTNLDKTVQQIQQNGSVDGVNVVNETTLNAIVEEFNTRTEILAGEIAEIKDMLNKLQSFTLEVNQKMYERLNQTYLDVVETDE
jgi:chorismate mutase